MQLFLVDITIKKKMVKMYSEHNGLEVEATQVFTDGLMNKQNVVYT